ncbi:DUF5681 domain-containing protein [Tropicimonas sp. IMCC6043]|uniref:DUF5681 domain-containing protein n=1 Tax=Tropicimonas sp. IMCC6043 TaxID=2510645 RepID=UPI00101E16DD|nr:DUF5681 domain-containing protein [Tropicimonas sp. IMCC6043]RYH06263.1 hypothetical protein EU800_24465 [Tropicimonas sp. IMCC6043]
MSDPEKDYEVGYGRPPKATQFKKGQSGNPKGRPKGAKGFNASLQRELETKVTVREGNREIKISKAEAAAKRLVATALKGDMKALTMLARFDADLSGRLDSDAEDAALSDTAEPVDYDILRHLFATDLGDDECGEVREADDEDS